MTDRQSDRLDRQIYTDRQTYGWMDRYTDM